MNAHCKMALHEPEIRFYLNFDWAASFPAVRLIFSPGFIILTFVIMITIKEDSVYAKSTTIDYCSLL